MAKKQLLSAALICGLGLASTQPLWAHAFMINKDVPAGAWEMVEIAIPHGCKGSPTNTVKIKMPSGVFNARPEVKPGWTLEVKTKVLPEPITIQDVVLSEIADEIVWSGGSLPDTHLERFSFLAKMPTTPGERLYFKIVQLCDEGEHRWVEIPEEGRPWSSYKEPAPYIDLGEATRPGPPNPKNRLRSQR